MPDFPDSLAVVCHDAGAANIIFSWLQGAPPADCRIFVQGPAAHWAHRFDPRQAHGSLAAALDGAAMLLSGTGWGSAIEHDARRMARERGLYSVAVLDHWVNYAERFQRDGSTVLPDEFWVTDETAFEIAQQCFPQGRIRQQRNAYLDTLLSEIGQSQAMATDDLLYVLEPARSDWGRGSPGEFQALDYLLENLAALGLPQSTAIRLRPHPSDPPHKYAQWLARQQSRRVLLDDSASLAEAIARTRWVAGCESFALVVALAAGRKVVCTLPSWAPPCRLPHRGLVHLKTLAPST